MDFLDFALGFIVGANVAWFVCDRMFRKKRSRDMKSSDRWGD